MADKIFPSPLPDVQPNSTESRSSGASKDRELRYVQYDSKHEAIYLSAIRQLISTDLSEPYSIYVYRYFLYQWGDLCFMVRYLPQY